MTQSSYRVAGRTSSNHHSTPPDRSAVTMPSVSSLGLRPRARGSVGSRWGRGWGIAIWIIVFAVASSGLAVAQSQPKQGAEKQRSTETNSTKKKTKKKKKKTKKGAQRSRASGSKTGAESTTARQRKRKGKGKQTRKAKQTRKPARSKRQVKVELKPANSVPEGIQFIADELTKTLQAQPRRGLWRMAVLPFDDMDREARDRSLGKIGSELLSARLLKKPKMLLVERSRLDAVIGELERSESGALTPETAASVGELLGANTVVVGSVAGSGGHYLITARIVSAETGRVIAASDRNIPRARMISFSEEVVEVRTKLGAGARSAALPGWGQMYNGDTTRGLTYSGLYLATGGGAIASAMLARQAANDYTSNSQSMVGRRDDANIHYNRVNLFLIALGVVWASSVLDAYLTGEDKESINLDLAPESVVSIREPLGISFRF